jgi:nucleotide-binding universal stress UspA family protein
VSAFDCILLPLDGSARAEIALRWVDVLPARQVRLLSVCQQGDALTSEATKYLEETAARLERPGRAVVPRIAYGEPADGIVADAVDVDLIVMSTQGQGGGGRLLYGSVADRVARHAPVPTLLLRDRGAPVSTAPVRRVVVPLDGSQTAELALPMAALLAQMLASSIHLVTVSDQSATGGLPAANRAAAFDAADAYLERTTTPMRASGVLISLETRSGDAATALLATIDPGDLLVMTTHGRGAARRWQIGTVAVIVLRRAPAPVVLIRADAP